MEQLNNELIINHKYNTRFKNQRIIGYYNEDNSDDLDEYDKSTPKKYIKKQEISKETNAKQKNIDNISFQDLLAELFPSNYMRNKAYLTDKIHKPKHYNIIFVKSNILNNGKYSNSILSKNMHNKKKSSNPWVIETIKDNNHKLYRNKNNDEEDSNNDDDEEDSNNDDDEEDSNDEDEDSHTDDDEEDSNDEDEDSHTDDDEEDSHTDDEEEDSDMDDDDDKRYKIIASNFKNKSKNVLDALRVMKKNQQINHKRKKQKQTSSESTQFKKLIDLDEDLDDVKYFKKHIDKNNQTSIINNLKNINTQYKINKPYRILVLESQMSDAHKIVALKKIAMLESIEPGASEYFKLKTWLGSFMRLPFNRIQKFPISINDGVDKCSEYMKDAVYKLDNAVYGLNDAKMQIMQLVGQWLTNPSAIGTAMAIKGPMGTGKTTLVKDGISKILNRPFSLIALGGATDASVLEGHSYTYEGSMYGKIVDILIQTQCSNPIIYFDELDKVSDTPKGEEIIGILTHLIDATQNTHFHDKYFSEIDFDLSKALFIFSYNDESKINPILRDRMYRISTKGYNKNDKNIIAKQYLLPAICKQINFNENDIVIDNETLNYIIDNYTENEYGVRNLKRCLEIIYTKLNLYRLMPIESSLFKEEKSFEVKFPFTVNISIVEKLIKKRIFK